MAIVLSARPAFEIVNGSFDTPEPPWDHLGAPEVRPRLEAVIRAVARIESDDSRMLWATGFAIAPDLVITMAVPKDSSSRRFAVFDDAVRVPATERIPLSVGGIEWELLRLRLPDGVVPVQPQKAPTDSLTGKEIVVVGYPSSDGRNDPALIQRVFGGVLDVKQLLPGQVTGVVNGVLLHDSSTLGGCAGAPLLDIATGDVLGIHYGGEYLKTNYAVPIAEVAAETALATKSPATRRRPRRRSREAVEFAEQLGSTISRFANSQLRVFTAARAVGWVSSDAPDGVGSGTAFLVGDRLALTASFVAASFAEGSGRQVRIRDNCNPLVDFSDCLGKSPGTAISSIISVRFIHPYFHVAQLELDQTPQGVERLELTSQLPADLASRPIVLIGCAPPGIQRISFGQALQVGQLPEAPGDLHDKSLPPGLFHDCNASPGSAGGPIVDLGTGYVIGVHTHGTFAATGEDGAVGFAQPPWELARDPVLWDMNLGFQPNPRPSWLDRWGVVGASRAEPVQLPAPPGRWTVDQVPIDWSLPEPRALEALLIGSIDGQSALILAENVGLQPGRVVRDQPLHALWRDLMKSLATAGLLRRLLEDLASQKPYGGIAPQLRQFL